MSHSSTLPELTNLSADGPPGIEIQIIDGRYQVLARGTEFVEKPLPQGIYIVRWMLPEKPDEKMVRLLPSATGQHVKFPGIPAAPKGSARDVFARVAASAEKAPQQQQSDIVILVRNRGNVLAGSTDSENDVRLFDRDEVAMRSDSSALAAAQTERLDTGAAALKAYRVPAGNYRIRYMTCTGLQLDQTIVAINGRRTLVFLTREATETLLSADDKFKRHTFYGVNPERTVVLTVPIQAGPVPAVNDVRMAEVLLDALAIGGDPLDERMLARLNAVDTDPLLRLYAAALIVSQLARKGSPALDDPYPASPATKSASDPAVQDFEKHWRGKALDLIKGIVPQDSSPDLFALRWELGHTAEGSLTAPTMLAISWECAARHSTGTESAVPDTASFRGASLGRVAAGPWLAWRPSSAKETSLLEDSPKAASKSLDDALSEFTSGLASAIPSNTDLPALHDTLSKLSVGTRGLISAARDLNFAPNQARSAAANLAGTLLTPAGQLRDRLQQATQELAAANASPPPRSRSSSAEPPALRRAITHFDDPQKGRFGGQPERDGFELTASFEETNDPKWVQINLLVTAQPGPPQTATEAEFFLHDTFRRERIKSPFQQGEAHLPLRAFGGFTVGVWIASHQIELELDLAELPDAPTIVKEW
ncbi:hypothetical protein AB7M63_000654 [Bradyrhizobium japonicum]|jgi:hypothetical protein